MIGDETIKKQISNTLTKTEFNIGKFYKGKVRDNYIFDNKRLLIVTDRISAFDRVLGTIPFKGQVLNQLGVFWFNQTKEIVDNHLIKEVDPNVVLAKECKPLPVEMIIRGYLTGVTTTSVWHNYEKGVRNYCGNVLPDGLVKNQKFEKPIITPTTKAVQGEHDELISGEEIIKQGLVDEKLYRQMEEVALKLYNFGVQHVSKQNLILVDTKYEFGLYDGKLVAIDEIHTPDSSRFWIKDTYEDLFNKGKDPQKLDKEYVRQYMADQGFLGEGDIPPIPDNVKVEAAKRYIKAYEMVSGQEFTASNEDVPERIKNNLKKEGLI